MKTKEKIVLFLVGCVLLGCMGCVDLNTSVNTSASISTAPAPTPSPTPTLTSAPAPTVPAQTPTPALTPVQTPLSFKERLIRDVQSAPYNTSDYKANEFDCSNMATLMYDWLKMHGYDIKFVFTMGGNWLGHAWLVVGDVDVPLVCTGDFCAKTHRTADGKGTVTVITMGYNGYKRIRLTDNSYWVEPTAKKVFHDLDEAWPGFYNWRKIYIFDDYRHASGDVGSLLATGVEEEFSYDKYLIEHYGTNNLSKIAKMLNN